jgi:ABC-type glycerol-3-phosphate transport system permease component
LKAVYEPKPTLDNFKEFLGITQLWKLFKNTLIVALISEIGVLFSSIAVAYGFSRFRIPGGKYLFFLLIATIMIQQHHPYQLIFYSGHMLNWIGMAPLIVPHSLERDPDLFTAPELQEYPTRIG